VPAATARTGVAAAVAGPSLSDQGSPSRLESIRSLVATEVWQAARASDGAEFNFNFTY
jgi:hypothetical protein